MKMSSSSNSSTTEIESSHKSLVLQGNAVADPEAGVRDGMDLIIFKAAAEGNMDTLEQHSKNLHQTLTPTKNTVLHVHIAYACQSTTTNMAVDKIIEMCPPLLFQANESGDTPLHIAARYEGAHHIVQILLDEAAKSRCHHQPAGTDVSTMSMQKKLIRTTNKENNTALHDAVRFNCSSSTVRLLIEADPEFVYHANNAGDTPIYLAAQRRNASSVSQILRTCKYPTYAGRDRRTALHAAVIANHNEMTREILEHSELKALTKGVDGRGWSPLHFAALMGHTSIAKQLLECDKHAAYIGDTESNKTPLHLAASEGHEEVMNLLISYSPDCCEVVDHKDRNALHYAVESCQIHILDFVLMNHPWLSNVLLNGKDADGNTPLHLFARNFLHYYYINAHYNTTKRFRVDSRIDKMAFNNENLNALDIILANDTISSSLKKNVGVILENKLKGVIHSYHHPIIGGGSSSDIKFDKAAAMKQAIDAHLVVATLIATVAFAAGFTMPGGYHQNENGSNLGFAVLTTKKNVAFKIFVIADTLAMAFSCCAVLTHFYLATLKPRKLSRKMSRAMILTTYALFSMVVAFLSGTYAVLGDSPHLASLACVLASSIFAMAFFYLWKLKGKFGS